MVGVFDGILDSGGLALEWALLGSAIGALLGKRALNANWAVGGAVVGLFDGFLFDAPCLLDLDPKWALGRSPIRALLGIGPILLLVG